MFRRHAQTGFTLLELAIVLMIVSLLAGGLLSSLPQQIEQQKLSDTRQTLNDIRSALLGYALLYGNLPCPTTVTDPAQSGYGMAASSCNGGASSDGILPWKTLGVAETDAWGSQRTTATDGWNGYWRYRVDRNFAASAISLNTSFSVDALSVRDSSGNTLTTTTERPVAIVYSTGRNLQADGQNASFEASGGIYQSDAQSPIFDDQIFWLSRPALYERLVSAGRLP